MNMKLIEDKVIHVSHPLHLQMDNLIQMLRNCDFACLFFLMDGTVSRMVSRQVCLLFVAT